MRSIVYLFIGASICFMGISTAHAKAGGKNFEYRKKLCTKKNEYKSYALPHTKLSSKAKVLSVKWHPNDYKVNKKKTWKRGSRKKGGVCSMEVSIANKGTHTVFHDGCSGQWPKIVMPKNKKRAKTWGEMFHPACVRHDHCYHHEPKFSKRNQKYCDDQMLKGMRNICTKQFGNSKSGLRKCTRAADKMHTALRIAGKKHYKFMNSKVPYVDLYEKR